MGVKEERIAAAVKKVYKGRRDEDGVCIVTVHEEGKPARPLNPRLDLFNHSPTGFEWGYGGSGPAQLALALLADVTGNDDGAVRAHQSFKSGAIASIPRDASWTMYIKPDGNAEILYGEHKHQ